MRIALRVDASLQIGTGHVMRCLTLADALAARGADCQFLCREHEGNLIEYIRGKGYVVHALPIALVADSNATTDALNELISPPLEQGPTVRPEPVEERCRHRASTGHIPSLADGAARTEGRETNGRLNNSTSSDLAHSHWLGATQAQDAEACAPILAAHRPDWLIVDHYGLDARWERALAPHYRKLMVIDDLADRPHVGDLLLDQNWHGEQTAHRYDALIPPAMARLLGPQYALLKPEYRQLRALLPSRYGLVGRVLVFIGGSDPANQSEKVLKALMAPEFSGLLVDVVIGANHPDPGGMASLVTMRPATVLHRNLPSLAGLMARADLMISAGGSTTWERLCLGLPGLVISIAGNQTATQRALMAAGYCDFLGEMNAVDDGVIAQALRQALKNPDRLIEQSRRCQALVDGDGANHVAQYLLD